MLLDAIINNTRNKKLDLTKKLLQAGANVNITARITNESPLHVAAEMNQTPLIKLLLDHGADSNAKDQCGCTPIYYAENSETIDLNAYTI